MCNINNTDITTYFHWINDESGFRKLYINYQTEFETEFNKFNNYDGEFKRCVKCDRELPSNMYFFTSFGKRGLHFKCKECEGTKFGWGRITNTELNNKGLKYCSKCDRILPLNEFYFNKSNGRFNIKTGYQSNCKECNNNSFRISSINGHRELFEIRDGYKICTDCMLELPDTSEFFFAKPDRQFGSTQCKKCKSNTDYGNLHPNVSLKSELKDGEKFCTICHTILKSDQISWDNERPLCLDCYREDNKYQTAKRRSMRNNLESNLSIQDWKETLEFFDNSCSYCGIGENDCWDKYHKHLAQEHIIPLINGGHFNKNNIIPSCPSCNCSKNTKSLDEFYINRNLFTYERYQKILQFIKDNTTDLCNVI